MGFVETTPLSPVTLSARPLPRSSLAMFSGALQDTASVENPIGLAGGHACSLLNQWLQTPAQVKDE